MTMSPRQLFDFVTDATLKDADVDDRLEQVRSRVFVCLVVLPRRWDYRFCLSPCGFDVLCAQRRLNALCRSACSRDGALRVPSADDKAHADGILASLCACCRSRRRSRSATPTAKCRPLTRFALSIMACSKSNGLLRVVAGLLGSVWFPSVALFLITLSVCLNRSTRPSRRRFSCRARWARYCFRFLIWP